MLAEVSSTEISKNSKNVGYDSVKFCKKKGGNIAKNAREQLEKDTGRKVVTSTKNKELPKKILFWEYYCTTT